MRIWIEEDRFCMGVMQPYGYDLAGIFSIARLGYLLFYMIMA